MFIQKVIEALDQASVQYALVGGYAVALHGAIRGTVDVDIAIAMNKTSLTQCEQALESIGLKSRLPITAHDVFTFRKEYIENRNLIAWSFVNPANPMQVVDILITEDAKKIKCVTKSAFGISVKVASIPDLILMKKKAGRPQDIEDIKALEKLQ